MAVLGTDLGSGRICALGGISDSLLARQYCIRRLIHIWEPITSVWHGLGLIEYKWGPPEIPDTPHRSYQRAIKYRAWLKEKG